MIQEPGHVREVVIGLPLNKPNKKFEFNLEALRGAAALFVVIGHIINYDYFIDPGYSPPWLKSFMPNGHFAVLLFFILSGYVIGLTNKQGLNLSGVGAYVKKRFIRLYPIYFISLVFTFLISNTSYSAITILGNFLFLDVILVDVVFENNPIWSLQYEIVYYLLFIPISLFRINPIIVIIGSVVLGMINFLLIPLIGIPLISSYLFGFCFWSIGLLLAKYTNNNNVIKASSALLISALFLFLSLSDFNFVKIIFTKIESRYFTSGLKYPITGLQGWFKSAIPLEDLTYLPFCIIFILLFSNRRNGVTELIYKSVFVITIGVFLYNVFIEQFNFSAFIGPSIYLLLGTVLLFYRNYYLDFISNKFILLLIWIGSLSYGIYIIHFPVLIIFKQINYFTGSILSFMFRALLLIILTIFLSYFLEKKVQPLVRRFLQ